MNVKKKIKNLITNLRKTETPTQTGKSEKRNFSPFECLIKKSSKKLSYWKKNY